jgi:shikimate dehydrogenase
MMYGLLGNPINRSWSEVLFNRIFELKKSKDLYAAINISPHTLNRFMEQSVNIFEGFNVTIPYKEEILKYVNDREPLVWKSEVANVIKREGGGYTAFNTDYAGLDYVLHKNDIEPEGKSVAIAGSGGLAKIVIYYLLTNYSLEKLHIFSRNPDETKKRIKGTWQYENMDILGYEKMDKYDILINCTPLGMNTGDPSPFHMKHFGSGSVAIDLTYQQENTKFMDMAKKCEGRGVNGMDMFFKQAAETYNIFFDEECDPVIFKNAKEDTVKWMTRN